ncbi:hypothetical protein AMTR_s00027p00236290 [Amborella trichopoda]|uniref:GST C-terminal domain-containing protein n=1 Tax=Amborella trichopoda TaxID=13333 RepID=W1PU56_AMBTC|nr:hypothetical protein AMTR_s00027p00236290 [Amborella trichopoda]
MQGEQQEKSIKDAKEAVQTFERGLQGKFFSGETIGLVDIVGVIHSMWMLELEEAMGVRICPIS